MAALLSSNLNDITTLTEYMGECQQMGIKVLSPDVNESMLNFSSNRDGDIRFGLGAIKGVGEAAAMSIISEREKNGPYKDIYDFFERVNYSVVNRKCLESIAYAGGFDSIATFTRCKFFAPESKDSSVTFLEQLVKYGQRQIEEKQNAQQSLFGMFGGGAGSVIQRPNPPVCEEWSTLRRLGKEREVVGLYLSSHPLDDYKVIINHMCKSSLADLADLESLNGQEIGFAGVVTSVQEMTTKTGRHWGKFTMEDYNSTHEFALFGKDYENFRQYLFPNYFLFVKGKVQPRPYGDNPELEFKIVSMVQLSEVQDSMIKELHVHLPIEELTQSFVTDFAEKVKSKSNKKANIILRMTLSDRTGGTSLNMYSKRYKIILEQDFIDYLDRSGLKYTLS
jgi:DNA polymerase-3 subunit alpha